MSKQVYIAKCDKAYKIGISDDPEARIKHLQTANPKPITLVAQFEAYNAEDCEKRLHKIFKIDRIQGEWFSLPSSLVRVIRIVAEDVSIDRAVDWIEQTDRTTMRLFMHFQDQYDELILLSERGNEE